MAGPIVLNIMLMQWQMQPEWYKAPRHCFLKDMLVGVYAIKEAVRQHRMVGPRSSCKLFQLDVAVSS